MCRLRNLIAMAIVFGVFTIRHASADTASGLAAIADTADRICGIVKDKGQADTKEAQLQIQAELNGLARRLATVGVNGGGKIATTEYEGLLQKDLPTTLQDIRNCKLQVLKSLQSTILPETAQISGPGAPSSDLLQAPGNAPSLDSTKAADYGLDLYSCANEANSVTCYVVFSRIGRGSLDYGSTEMTRNTRLVDNFHDQHRLRKAFFLDGLGNHQLTTNLAQGESIWLVLDFEPGARPISSARLIFGNLAYNPQLHGPVN